MQDRRDSTTFIEPDVDGSGLRIGIVTARFNAAIGEGLLAACTTALGKHGVADANVVKVSVPGALEIPLALQKMANTRKFDALIALGSVIRGETYHFEIVSDESAQGVMSVQLDSGIPIANGILTTENEEQARARMEAKGADCAAVAVEMVNLLRKFDQK